MNKVRLCLGANFLGLLKHKKLLSTKHIKITLTRIGLPANLACHKYNCDWLPAHFCLISSSMKSPTGKATVAMAIWLQIQLERMGFCSELAIAVAKTAK